MEIKLSPQPEDDNNNSNNTQYQEPNNFKSVVVDSQPQQMGFGDDSLNNNSYYDNIPQQPSQPYTTPSQPYTVPNQVYNSPNQSYQNTNPYNSQPNAYQQSTPQTKFCKHCGKTIPIDAVVCTQCGRQVEQLNQSNPNNSNTIINNINTVSTGGFSSNGCVSDKNNGVAIVLALIGFFGLGGLHRFYTGKIGTGLLYLLTWGLFGVGTVVDLITLISGNFKDSHGLPLK